MNDDPLSEIPVRASARWQGAVVPLCYWTEPEGEKPRRALGAVWVDVEGQPLHLEPESGPSGPPALHALRALERLALDANGAGYLPGTIEVSDRSLAEGLERRLERLGVRVEVVAETTPAVEAAVGLFNEEFGNSSPGIFDAPDVFDAEARSFYEAARLYYRAAPWKELTDEDLIRIESPTAPVGFGHAIVLGSAGQQFGLCLVPSRDEHERILEGDASAFERNLSVFFGPIDELPPDDAEWMVGKGIEVAGRNAWPWALETRSRSTRRRPSARLLARAEIVMRALAAATPEDLDRGRVTARVRSVGRDVEVTLALPELLEEPPPRSSGHPPRVSPEANEKVMTEIARFASTQEFGSMEDLDRAIEKRFRGPIDNLPSTAVTPLEKAQEICWKAWEARGRKVRLLALEALALSPDCTDAYVLLARSTPSREEMIALLRQGVEAGERVLGRERLEAGEGEFWSDVSTRPFMRAMQHLVMELSAGPDEERREAIQLAQRVIELNPDDNQGVRYTLVGLYLALRENDAARRLLGRFDEDRGAILEYARALAIFREEGDTASSRKALRRAVDANRMAGDYLTAVDEPDSEDPSSYSPGSPEEAALVLLHLGRAWDDTAGADEWAARVLAGKGGGRGRRG